MTAIVVGMHFATPTWAAVTGATSTTTTTAAAGETVALAGMTVSSDVMGESISVIISTDVGSLAVALAGTSATINYGYSSSGSEVAFTGSLADVNTVLSTVTLTTAEGAKGSDAEISIVARSADDTVYSPSTGHFYEYVPALNIAWTDARTAAQTHFYGGQQGYLASVPNADVNTLIAQRIENAQNAWIGGQGFDNTDGYPRVWKWADGPRAGETFTRCSSNAARQSCDFVDSGAFYYSWASGEPNNWDSVEFYTATNYVGSPGMWNDYPNDIGVASGYVVEYGDADFGATGGFAGLSEDSSTVALVGVPDPVTSLSAAAGQGSANVSWDAPANDGGSAITEYVVTVDPTAGDASDCAGTATSCTITGLTPGTEYTVTVVAVNTEGNSESRSTTVTPVLAAGVPTGPLDQMLVGVVYSDFVTAAGYPDPTFAVTAGALPAGLTLDATTGEVSGTPTTTGSWSAQITATNASGSATSVFSGAVGQVPAITTATVGPFTWGVAVDVNLAADGFPVPAWSATAVPPGLTLDSDGRLHGTPTEAGVHDLTVTATNTHGSDVETFLVTIAAVVADAPTITDIRSGDGMLTLTVEPPTANGGATITSYEYSLDGGLTWVTAAMTDGEIEIDGLTNGTEYSVQVRAVNAVGAGAASAAVLGTPNRSVLSFTGTDLSLIPPALLLVFAGLGLVIGRRRFGDAARGSSATSL
jgi:hypothetical protein